MAKALRVQNHILEDDTAALVLHHNASLQGIPQDLDLAPSLAESSFWRVRPSIESTGTGYPLFPKKRPAANQVTLPQLLLPPPVAAAPS